MRGFVAVRSAQGSCAVWRLLDHFSHPLAMRKDVYHSSDDVEWGTNGPGSKQLAFAILAEVMKDDEAASQATRAFCQLVVSTLPRGGWWMSEDLVQSFLIGWVAVHKMDDDVIHLGTDEGCQP